MQETMDEFMETINPRTYIIIEALSTVSAYNLIPKNNYSVFDGFFLDVEEIKKNKYRFRIRQDFLKDIVGITFDSTGFVIKFSTEFYIYTNKIQANKEILYKCNLVKNVFSKNDLSTLVGTEIEYNIDADALNTALIHCERIYNEIQTSRIN